MSFHQAKPEHEILYLDICQMLSKHGDLPARELLAVAANLVGKLVAMQDQRTMTPAEAMEIVAMNIEHGNKQVLDQLAASRGSV